MRTISRVTAYAAGLLLTASLVPASAALGAVHADRSASDGQILRATVAGSLTSDPLLFGVRPGGAPWTVEEGTVRLGADGSLDVKVEGLIIPTNGVNPLPALAASVVCNGAVVATTATVPFSPTGDARIRTTVALPVRCLAPAVLLNPNGNPAVFIGATGREA
ncbi:MAG TPA: hypothetical protein VGK35_03400 [Actinotalea sp.]